MSVVLNIGSDVIRPDSVVRDLGVLMDQELSMKQHIAMITSSCFFRLRRLKHVRRILTPEITANLVPAFATSRLRWLPVLFRITYKLCVLIHLVHIRCSPVYLTELVTATSERVAISS